MAVTTTQNTYPTTGILREEIMSAYDAFEKPEVAAQLFSRYGYQFMNTYNLLRSMGREEAVAQDEFTAFEENRYHNTIELQTAITGGASTEADIEIASDATVSGGITEENFGVYVREGDIITDPDSDRQYLVQKVAWDTDHWEMSIESVDGENIAAHDIGTTFAITNGAHGAGTKQPKGTILGQTQRDFQAQIFKESVGLEGSEMVNQKWAQVLSRGGQVKGWYTPGTMRADYLMGLRMDGAFTFGQKNHSGLTVPATDGDGNANPGAGNVVKTTKGIVPWIRDLGLQIDASAEDFDLDLLELAGLHIKRQGVESKYVLMYNGAKLNNKIDRSAFEYLDSNGTDYTEVMQQLFNGRKELAMSVNFKALTYSDFTFIKKENRAWSDPMTWGGSNYVMQGMGILYPLSYVKDQKTKESIPNIGIKYRAMDGYSRRMETWSVKGAGPGLKVTSVDRADFYFRSHMMFTFLGANQGVIFEGRTV